MTLDFSKDPDKGPYARLRDAQRLRAVIDRMAVIDYAKISDDPDGSRFRFPPDAVSQPIVIERLIPAIGSFLPRPSIESTRCTSSIVTNPG